MTILRGRSLVYYVAFAGAMGAVAPSASAQADAGYARSSSGTRHLTFPNGTSIKLLLEAANLGSNELEVAEITFAPGAAPTAGHRHGAIEIFYVVEGVLGHVVNGVEHRLEAGMLGVVKPGDSVIHRVLSTGPVKAVVIWAPGGEASRIAPVDRWAPLGKSPL